MVASASEYYRDGQQEQNENSKKTKRSGKHPIYHGVRMRNWGKWVTEIREPKKKSRIWLGTFSTPDMAARAHDVAALSIKGTSAILNFPELVESFPRPVSLSPRDIQTAALKAAHMHPTTSFSVESEELGQIVELPSLRGSCDIVDSATFGSEIVFSDSLDYFLWGHSSGDNYNYVNGGINPNFGQALSWDL